MLLDVYGLGEVEVIGEQRHQAIAAIIELCCADSEHPWGYRLPDAFFAQLLTHVGVSFELHFASFLPRVEVSLFVVEDQALAVSRDDMAQMLEVVAWPLRDAEGEIPTRPIENIVI